MSGRLTVPHLAVNRASGSYGLFDGKSDGAMTLLVQQVPSTNRLSIMEYSPNTNYYEGYRLPTPNSGLTAHANYDILTTKEPVTIAQGGTGSTSAEAARKKLEVPQWIDHGSGSATIAEGATIKLSSSITSKSVFANLNYRRTVGYVAGGTGSKTITFSSASVSGSGIRFDIAYFGVSDDGLTLTAQTLRRVNISSSGSVSIENGSVQFGLVQSVMGG